MRAFEVLDAAVAAVHRVDGDDGVEHVGKEDSVLVPVAEILMPAEASPAARRLHVQGVVVVVDLAAEQQLGRFDQPRAACDRAEQIVSRPLPHDLDDAVFGLPLALGRAEGLLPVDDVLSQGCILDQRTADETDLFVVEAVAFDEEAVFQEALVVCGREVGVRDG